MNYPVLDDGHFYADVSLWPGMPVNDAFLFGDSIFTSFATLNGHIPWWNDHRRRLIDGWKWRQKGDTVLLEERMENGIAILRKVITDDLVVRITLYCAGSEKKTRILITTRALPHVRPVKLMKATIESPRISLPNFVKCGNYLLARREVEQAKSMGFDEVVFLSREGHILEASTSNIFLAKDGIIKTPSLFQSLLAGISRKYLIEFYQLNNIIVQEKELVWSDLTTADEIFLTNSVKVVNGFIDTFNHPGPLFLMAQEMMAKRDSL